MSENHIVDINRFIFHSIDEYLSLMKIERFLIIDLFVSLLHSHHISSRMEGSTDSLMRAWAMKPAAELPPMPRIPFAPSFHDRLAEIRNEMAEEAEAAEKAKVAK
jgi:hypothetical protein